MKKQIKLNQNDSYDSFSPAIVAGDFVFISGQGPIDQDTGKIVGSTIADQTTATIKNVFNVLKKANATPDDIVKVNVYLKNIEDFKNFNEIYKKIMPRIKPVRATVVAELLVGLIEIECIAYLPK